jgi:hypothetical protein
VRVEHLRGGGGRGDAQQLRGLAPCSHTLEATSRCLTGEDGRGVGAGLSRACPAHIDTHQPLPAWSRRVSVGVETPSHAAQLQPGEAGAGAG